MISTPASARSASIRFELVNAWLPSASRMSRTLTPSRALAANARANGSPTTPGWKPYCMTWIEPVADAMSSSIRG